MYTVIQIRYHTRKGIFAGRNGHNVVALAHSGLPVTASAVPRGVDPTVLFPLSMHPELSELMRKSYKGWSFHSVRLCGAWELNEDCDIALLWLWKPKKQLKGKPKDAPVAEEDEEDGES